jgi:chromosome segregation ATPase
MAKKTVSKEYLEKKLKELEEQIRIVEDRIDQYSQMWQKLSGAIELTSDMLKEFEEEKVEVKE